MTATSGFDLHPEAAQAITEIWEDIASDNPAAAGRVRNDILQAIRDLVSFPRSGHRRPDLTGRPLRFNRVWDYLLAYAPDESPLWVVAVIHGRRNPRVIAAILRRRKYGKPRGRTASTSNDTALTRGDRALVFVERAGPAGPA
jgi:toxin ParE1/3/4